MSTNELGRVAAGVFASEYRDPDYVWSDGEIRRWHDVVAAVLAVSAVRRIFRAGDDEPDEYVRAVLDRRGGLWVRSAIYGWTGPGHTLDGWEGILSIGPVVEVVLPEPVTE